MVKQTILSVFIAASSLSALVGCAPTVIGSDNGRREGRMYGDYGVAADGSYSRIEGGSLIAKLSILGNKNTVIVDDDVAMAKIEIWGSNNDIELPYGLNPYFTQVGKNNVVRNRPAPWAGAPTRGVETTRTTTVVELDQNGPPTVTTTPGSASDGAHHGSTTTQAPERTPRTEPANPESIP